jgi:uncharacterized membrane protein YphA (DoxX/SURF4 family)
MTGLVHAHSGLRYIALLLLVIALMNAFSNIKSGKYSKKDKMINLFAMVMLHIQLLIGLVLYFFGQKVGFSEWIGGGTTPPRFFAFEHILIMLVAIVFITLGRKKAENHAMDSYKHKLILRYYGLGLILIFIAIPWPFIYTELGLGYF